MPFSAFEERSIMKQVEATHCPNGNEVDVKPMFQIIENILIQVIARGTFGDVEGKLDRAGPSEKSAASADFNMLDSLAIIIANISCELAYKCSGVGDADADANAIIIALLKILSTYSWHAKVVFILAGFAINVGEFWLLVQSYAVDTLGKSVALLKKLPDIIENSASLKSMSDAINRLVKAALDLTRCIAEFKELSSEYNSEDIPPMFIATANSQIPTAAYWIIRSLVACSSRVGRLRNGNNSSTTELEERELASLADKMSSIHESLNSQLVLCYQSIDDNRRAFYNLSRLFESINAHSTFRPRKKKRKNIRTDNLNILKALICNKEDPLPLLLCSNKRKASLEVLKRRHVLLLISDLDVSEEEIAPLYTLYRDAKLRGETHYEIVWIPVVNKVIWDDDLNKKKFENLQSMMSWYSVCNPLMIEPAVIKYIKEVWHFAKKPILVSLDPQGRLCSPNALHMILIWGNLAFPFTRKKEEALWNEQVWSLKLLFDGIDSNIVQWMTEDKLICLYGGGNLDWIQTFTSTTISATKGGNFALEMAYVGRSNSNYQMQRMIDTFTTRKFTYFLPNAISIWFFWARLESIWYSKTQHGKTFENDQIMTEVTTLLSFDRSDQGWAIFCKGASEMAKVKGDDALKSLIAFNEWKDNAQRDGFVPAFKDFLSDLSTQKACVRLILPKTPLIQERVLCADCGEPLSYDSSTGTWAPCKE